ncbi:MAG: hypothetical protein BWY87_01593 [Deltaproteobacteria bacterium ADurb.Bin510]|nr:MAG: hypothetical protein BWY87_01593 [Deltaproteobacteria bacterium ADurb.Bin510]
MRPARLSEAPKAAPGMMVAPAQSAAEIRLTRLKRAALRPSMPLTSGMMGLSGPMRRPSRMLLAPWALKNCSPRASSSGWRLKSRLMVSLSR